MRMQSVSITAGVLVGEQVRPAAKCERRRLPETALPSGTGPPAVRTRQAASLKRT